MSDLKARAVQHGSASLPVAPAIPTEPVRILLVDDQPARLLSYEAILSKLDVECVRAGSGLEALEQLMKQDYAVILLDVNMPGMDGYEVARLIRSHPRYERTPVIFVTAVYVTEQDRLRGYEVGAIDYISVPVIAEILIAKIAILVELYQRRRELQVLNLSLQEARTQLDAEHARAIAQSEAQLRIIFEHPTELAIVLDAERDRGGQIVDWIYRNANVNALNLLGITRDALVGRRLRDVAPDQAKQVGALCAKVLATREMTRYESHYAGRDFLVTLFPMGENAVVSSGLDITERKQTMAALRASERRYRALIESAPVAVAHNSLDGRFQYANTAFCQLVGYSVEELQQLTSQDITHPDDVDADQSLAKQALAGKIPHYTLEKRFVRKDGEIVWVRLFGNFVLDDEGRPDQGVAVVIDMTHRKLTEAALRESEERFRDLANGINQFVWTCDELGYADWYNDRWYEYTGTTFDEMRGEGWKKVHDPEHLERILSGLQKCVATGEPWEDTFPLRAKDGTYRWFLSRAVPVRDNDGRVVRWFGTNTDVTELRSLQEALKETARRKDEFLAVLAHELRNPVAPIRNAAEALVRLLPDEPSHRLAKMVQRQALQLARLLDDLLDVARITRGRIDLQREVVSVAACIQLAVETAQPLIREREHRLDVVVPAVPLFVSADKVRLAQCLGNLLNNAAKFTEPGGDIRIRAHAEGQDAVVEIVDAGIGIAADLLPRIFDRFVQNEPGLSQTHGGLGIGLSICKHLAEKHGGSISARSEGLGKGATFVVRLPRVEAAADVHVVEPATPPQSTRRVLIVDDNRDAADSLAALLKFQGHEVSTAYSGETALAHAAAAPPEVVLLDLGLPRMDGYEVARRMMQICPSARIVALSGYGQASDKERSAGAGFSGHLVKPVDLPALWRLLSAS
jgi:PAS domain S-box-containing protein